MREFWKTIASWFRNVFFREKNKFLYTFEAPILGFERSFPKVIKGEIDWIAQFIPVAEFQELFGGYITWRPTDEIGETIGVWGERNVSRFRRILKERGAVFKVVYNEGPKQRPWVVTTHGYTKKGRRVLARKQESQSKP